ncbi:Tuftelin-interacting protein 11 [Phytophthora boehmeriae]|uniref:Tuftelin-interacting protein 11 n=1 Tax=Phytophthora boehmeriae TaxID=109152 RepID=A0A8T1X802_9STRA|nr:Tuftelin-interacting protein 11 [Phytophthora boehmeriae]
MAESSADGGLSNADFARMFRKEARQEAAVEATHKVEDSPDATDTNDSFNPMRAARERRQELDASVPDDQELPTALGGSGLGFGARSGLGLGKDTSRTKSGDKMKAKSKTFGWEKHTTGFGTKMLAKMGFKGRLGKKEDGVSATIEVKQRPAQMGIGYGDFVEASNLKQNRRLQKELKGETVEEDEKKTQAFPEDDTLWRKRKAPAGRKRHKRATELAQELQDVKKQKRKDVVLDMRGPAVRVLSDVTAAYDVDARRLEAVKPKLGDELIYNVRMTVNLAQGKIYDLSQKIETNTENIAAMKKETKMIRAQLDVDDVRLQHMQEMITQVKKLDDLREKALEMQSVEPILSHLRGIQRSFPLEFDAHKLQQLIPSLCMPTLRVLLSATDLLNQTANDVVVEQLRLVQTFLTELPTSRPIKGTTSVLPVIREKTMAMGDDLYNYVLEETLWPAVVQCVNVQWQAKTNPSDCVDTFVKLRLHLTKEFEQAFLRQLVLPRLKKECQRWNPQTDAAPIQDWLIPWLPYLGSTMNSLYHDVRLALASALNQWNPSDLTVLSVLSPWRELWGEHEYAKFTHRHIVRKLIRCLHRDFEVNPQNQSLEALKWVLAWKDHLPERQFVALFEGEFFPKWLKVLRKWVNGTPNLSELEKWYSGWKLLFDKNGLATNERLIVYFHGALVLLQVAVESADMPTKSRPPIPELNRSAATNYQDALVMARDEEVKESPSRQAPASPRSVSRSVSLKDVIENMAISHNLTFMPKGFHDGQQVYSFGKHQIIIEQGVVFVERAKGAFEPVELEHLL